MQLNTQSLLFNETPYICPGAEEQNSLVPETFYREGHCVLKNSFDEPEEVADFVSRWISAIDLNRLPNFALFQNRIQLGKVDRIPSKECPDAAEVQTVSLHFDMGLPITPLTVEASVFLLTCLYFPKDRSKSDTTTRLFSLNGLLRSSKLTANELEERLSSYVRLNGDGWEEYNTGRITCLGRLIDAIHEGEYLRYMRDHRISEWFNLDDRCQPQDGKKAEQDFFKKWGHPLDTWEKNILLEPGDILLMDNTRLAHGRFGTRSAEELFQYLYGVEKAKMPDIDTMRKNLVATLLG